MDRAREKRKRRGTEKKRWRRGEGETRRETATKTERNLERHRASLRGQRGRETAGKAWWRVQVPELNPGSQGDRVPVGRPILNPLPAGSGEKRKRKQGWREAAQGREVEASRQLGQGAARGTRRWENWQLGPDLAGAPGPLTPAPDAWGQVEIPQDRIRGGARGRGAGEDQAFSLLFFFFPLN